MKAISIKQPWAQLIAQGAKTIELRTWQTKHRGPLLIVSSLKPDYMKVFKNKTSKELGTWCEDGELDGFYNLGAAICIVDLFDVTEFKPEHEAGALCDHYPGLYAWHLRNVKPVKPVKIRGKLNFYDVSNSLIVEI